MHISDTPVGRIIRNMSRMTAEMREYLAGLDRANEHEIEELRRTPPELKLRQLWALMTAAPLFGDAATREAEVSRIRERWVRLHELTSV